MTTDQLKEKPVFNKDRPDDLTHELVTLHHDLPELLFRYRKTLSHPFRDILRLLDIHHMAIDIITPQNIIVPFSSTPSMLFNLIENELWMYDGSISPTYFQRLPFYLWQQVYLPKHSDKLKQYKEREYHYRDGFTVVRKINRFYLLYSFATKNRGILWQPYVKQMNDLLSIGDYCYKCIRKIANPLCKPYVLPLINTFVAYKEGAPKDIAKEITDKIDSVGIRSMDSSELNNIDRNKMFYASEIFKSKGWLGEVINKLSKNVYVTIDLDVFDPGIMPSTGTPEPGGLNWEQVTDLLEMVSRPVRNKFLNGSSKRNIVGADVVELAPYYDPSGGSTIVAAKAIRELLLLT